MILRILLKSIVIIGALNWGFVGFTALLGARFNVVEWLLVGELMLPVAAYVVYCIIGVAGIALALLPEKPRKKQEHITKKPPQPKPIEHMYLIRNESMAHAHDSKEA